MNIEKARKLLQEAKDQLAKVHYHEDYALIAYILQDTEEIREAGLNSLCWELAKGDAYRGDIEGLLKLFEKAIEKEEK